MGLANKRSRTPAHRRPALPPITPEILADIERLRNHHQHQYQTTISEEAALILAEPPFFFLPAPLINDVDFKASDTMLTRAYKFVRLALHVKDALQPLTPKEDLAKREILSLCFYKAARVAQHVSRAEDLVPDAVISIAQLLFWSSRFQDNPVKRLALRQESLRTLSHAAHSLEQMAHAWRLTYGPVLNRVRAQILADAEQ